MPRESTVIKTCQQCGGISALLWAVDTVPADAYSAIVVKDFDGVAIEDGDDGTGEITGWNFAETGIIYEKKKTNNQRLGVYAEATT